MSLYLKLQQYREGAPFPTHNELVILAEEHDRRKTLLFHQVKKNNELRVKIEKLEADLEAEQIYSEILFEKLKNNS